jgi:SAM-dependent methyltransferase
MIEFAPLPTGAVPKWDGRRFVIENSSARVVAYSSNLEGWDDDLTELHESEAGDGQHPIDVASRKLAVNSLRDFSFPENGAVLEVGCSSGFLLRDLQREFPNADIVGADIALGALERLGATLAGIPLVQMDLLQCDLKSNQFDAVVAINVLEHIEDDLAALTAMARLLKPGGLLILEVPQGPKLYDYYDAWLRHFRRFTRKEILSKIASAGLRTERSGFLGFLPYGAFWIVKTIRRFRFGPRGERAPSIESMVRESIKTTRKSRALILAFAIENALRRRFHFPIGIRCVAVARKPTVI